jgi:hypothetical protein
MLDAWKASQGADPAPPTEKKDVPPPANVGRFKIEVE